jgi:hypothetical protein
MTDKELTQQFAHVIGSLKLLERLHIVHCRSGGFEIDDQMQRQFAGVWKTKSPHACELVFSAFGNWQKWWVFCANEMTWISRNLDDGRFGLFFEVEGM